MEIAQPKILMARIKGESRMKVSQEDTTFRPVTITLQTPYELSNFYRMVAVVSTSRKLVEDEVHELAQALRSIIDEHVDVEVGL